MGNQPRKLAVVTGASGGLGLELARLCAQNHYDLVIASEQLSILEAAEELACCGVTVSPVVCDLSAEQGVDSLRDAITASGKPVDILIANAGRGHQYIDHDVHDSVRDAHAYVEGMVYLIDQLSRAMRGRGRGRILITYVSHHAYEGCKDFLHDFSAALTSELKNSGVTVTCLIPPATESELIRGGASSGYDAIMRGAMNLAHGLRPRTLSAAASVRSVRAELP
jgi:short-subunit dehydrogenase